MGTMRMKLLGVLLALVGVTPLACLDFGQPAHQEPRQERTEKDVKVGGDKGVVVKRSDSNTEVKIGGDRGLKVEHPRDQTDDDQK